MPKYESYNYSGVIHRDNRHTPIEDEDKWVSTKKKKKKKKNNRSKHKHCYIPAVYNMSYKTNTGKVQNHQGFGFHCKKCGRVKNMSFLWTSYSERFERFKKEYPDYIEITLPENWDYFKDKVIPF